MKIFSSQTIDCKSNLLAGDQERRGEREDDRDKLW